MSDQKDNKYVELFKNTGLLAIGNFSSKILVFLLVPLYTNVLSKAEYGLYDLFITTVQLLIPILSLNVADGVLRFALENKERHNEVFRIALKFSLLSLFPATLVIIINYLFGINIDLSKYGFYVLGYYFSYMLNQLFVQFAKGIDRVSAITISGILGTVVTIIACILSLLVLKLGLIGFFYANILGQLIPAFYLAISLKVWNYFSKPQTEELYKSLQKRLLSYSIPLIMTTIGWWLNNTSDKYIITAIKGVDVNGLLSIAYKIPSILTIVYGIFIQAWQISAMKEYGKEDSNEYYNSMFVNLNLLVYFAASIMILFTRPLAQIAFSNDFYVAWIFVPYLLISAVFTSAAGYIAPVLTSAYKTKAVAMSTVIGGIINVVLNVALLYIMGNIGVAVATMISSFIILFVRYKSTDGIITYSSFIKGGWLWVFLVIQATLGVIKLEILEIPCIIICWVLNRDYLRSILLGLKQILRRGRS